MEENTNTMNTGSSNMISRIINIITKPKQEWNTVANETPNATSLFMGYAVPLALIPAISTVIGIGLIGKKVSLGFFGSYTVKSWELGIRTGAITFISSLVAIWITAFIVDALATSFKSEKNMGRSMQLVVYGYTPAWIAGIFNLVPAIAWLSFIAGLYSIYVLYLGYTPVKKTPEDKSVVYLLATIGILIVTYFVLALIIGVIAAAIYTPNLGSFGM